MKILYLFFILLYFFDNNFLFAMEKEQPTSQALEKKSRSLSLSFNKTTNTIEPLLSKKLKRRSIESFLKSPSEPDFEEKQFLLFDSAILATKNDETVTDKATKFQNLLDLLLGRANVPDMPMQDLVERKFTLLKFLTFQMLTASRKEGNEKNITTALEYRKKIYDEEAEYYNLICTDRGEHYKSLIEIAYKAANDEKDNFRKRMLYNIADSYCQKAKVYAHQTGNQDAKKSLYAIAGYTSKINSMIQSSKEYPSFIELLEKIRTMQQATVKQLKKIRKKEKSIFEKEEKLAMVSPKKLQLKRLNKKNLTLTREIIESKRKEFTSEVDPVKSEEIKKTIEEFEHFLERKDNNEIFKKILEYEIVKLKKNYLEELTLLENLYLTIAQLSLEAFSHNPQLRLVDQIENILSSYKHLQEKRLKFNSMHNYNKEYESLVVEVSKIKQNVQQIIRDTIEQESSLKDENVSLAKLSSARMYDRPNRGNSDRYRGFLELFFPTKKKFTDSERLERMKIKFALLEELYRQWLKNSKETSTKDLTNEEKLKTYKSLIRKSKNAILSYYHTRVKQNYKIGERTNNEFKKRLYLQKALEYSELSKTFFRSAYKRRSKKSKKYQKLESYSEELRQKLENSASIDFDKSLNRIHEKNNKIQESLRQLENERVIIEQKKAENVQLPKKVSKKMRTTIKEKINKLLNIYHILLKNLNQKKEEENKKSNQGDKPGDSGSIIRSRVPTRTEQQIWELKKTINQFSVWLKNEEYQCMAEKIHEIELNNLKKELFDAFNDVQDELLILIAELLNIVNHRPKMEYLHEAEIMLETINKIGSEKLALSGIHEVKDETTMLSKKMEQLKKLLQNPDEMPEKLIMNNTEETKNGKVA